MPKNRLQVKCRRTDCSRNAEKQTAAEEPNKKLQPESYPCEAGGLWASRARREPLVEQFAKTFDQIDLPGRMRRLWLPRNSVLENFRQFALGPPIGAFRYHQEVGLYLARSENVTAAGATNSPSMTS